MLHLMLHLMVHLTVQSRGKPKDTSEGALKDALSDLHIDVKKVHLRLHVRVHLRLHLKVAFDGALEDEIVSATEMPLRVDLKVHRRMYFEIYIKMHQKVLYLFQENIFRKTCRWLPLKHKKDIFNNHNLYDNKRCLHGSKIPHRIGLKRYLMDSSSRLLLNFLFWFAKIALIREGIVVLLKKRAAGCFRNLNK